MKKLTTKKLNNLCLAIEKWAKRWELDTTYMTIFTKDKMYKDGKFYPVNPAEYCEGWENNFIFGMAIDGDVYDVIHIIESYYYDAYVEFRNLLDRCNLAVDFYDSTHLTAFVLEDDE